MNFAWNLFSHCWNQEPLFSFTLSFYTIPTFPALDLLCTYVQKWKQSCTDGDSASGGTCAGLATLEDPACFSFHCASPGSLSFPHPCQHCPLPVLCLSWGVRLCLNGGVFFNVCLQSSYACSAGVEWEHAARLWFTEHLNFFSVESFCRSYSTTELVSPRVLLYLW